MKSIFEKLDYLISKVATISGNVPFETWYNAVKECESQILQKEQELLGEIKILKNSVSDYSKLALKNQELEKILETKNFTIKGYGQKEQELLDKIDSLESGIEESKLIDNENQQLKQQLKNFNCVECCEYVNQLKSQLKEFENDCKGCTEITKNTIEGLQNQLKDLKENYHKDLSDAIINAESLIFKDSIPRKNIEERIKQLKEHESNEIEYFDPTTSETEDIIQELKSLSLSENREGNLKGKVRVCEFKAHPSHSENNERSFPSEHPKNPCSYDEGMKRIDKILKRSKEVK